MKNNKRGILLPAVLKLILAAIGIGVLFAFLISLYFSVKDSRDLKLAEETLDFLMNEIKAERIRVDIFDPEEWRFDIWSYNSASGTTINDIPKSCSNAGLQSCICLCKDPGINVREILLGSCNQFGTCLDNMGFQIESEHPLVVVGSREKSSILIEDPPLTLNIDYTNKVIRSYSAGSGGYASASGGYGN